jgi:RNA-directed DNA polymerase
MGRQFRRMVRWGMYNGTGMVVLMIAGIWLGAGSSSGAEVGGIYTEPTTKDLGEITKIDFFKGLKFRGWIDTYFVGNFNDSKRSVVEANQPLLVIKSRDLTIEGRTFDVRDRSFSLSLAELEVEKVPEVGGVGFKLDLAFGDTQDIIVDTIQAASRRSSVIAPRRLGVSSRVKVPVGSGVATHPYRVLRPWRSSAREAANQTWATRRQRLLEAAGVTAPPEVRGPLRKGAWCGRRGFARTPKARPEHPSRRGGEGPPESSGRGRPEERRTSPWDTPDAPGGGPPRRGSTASEARQGHPGHGTRRAPQLYGGTHARQAERAHHRDRPLDAPGASEHAADSAVGKAPSTGKDRTAGRSPPRTLRPDTGGAAHQKPPALQGRANQANTDPQHRGWDLSGGLEAALLLDGWRDRNTPAASGVAGRTAHADAATLQATSTAVGPRLKTPRDRATRVRRGDSPKEHGTERPCGMPARADTLVHVAGAKLLRALSAPDLLDGRDGDRPGGGAWEAVRTRTVALQYGTEGSLGEADVPGVFDQLDPTRLVTMRRERRDDRAWLRLLRKWLQAGLLESDGHVGPPETGLPHGGSLSPVLAQGSLHDALDGWCAQGVKAHGRGEALLGRYAEDWVCACRYPAEAARFSRGVPHRLQPCTLPVAPDTPPLLRCSRFHPSRQRRVPLLGCERDGRPDRPGVPRVKRRTARKKLHAACRRRTAGSTQHRHLRGRGCSRLVHLRLRGHSTSYGLQGHSRSLHRFFERAMRCTFKWRNRRGGKRQSFPWEQCTQGWDRRGRARPRITEVKHRRVLA